MKLVQTLLCRKDVFEKTPEGTYMITWLPIDKRVRVGSVLSLQKVTGRWRVVEQFSRIESHEINRKWNNNI